MKYYKMVYDYKNDDKLVNCNVGEIGEIGQYKVFEGDFIDNWGDINFEYNSAEGDTLSDYIANVYRWLIVSNKFKAKTEKLASTSIQYLPIKITNKICKSDCFLYYVANIIDIIDALDLDNSQYDIFELDDEKIISVEKYALKKDKIKEHHIFRLKNDTIPVFISEEMKNIIEIEKMTGFDFLEVKVC